MSMVTIVVIVVNVDAVAIIVVVVKDLFGHATTKETP